MEQRLGHPNYDPARSNFLEYTKQKCALEVVDPGNPIESIPETTRPFVPRDVTQMYFERINFRELYNIIDGLKLAPAARVHPGLIVPRYTAVFCTLLHSGRGSYIKHFTRFESLQDTALPFDPSNPPKNWPPAPEDPGFLSEFCKHQWRFCAPILEYPVSDRCFEDERVLPITFKSRLRDGGTAKLWLIKVHPAYNKLVSEEYKKKVGEANANTFVLKEYSTADAQKYYDNETSAFGQIGKHAHIISYYGSFMRGGTFNVILEYADKGTLKEFFEKQLPPTSGGGILKFWEGLFQLIDALWKIHTVNGGETEGPQIFQGWHQDVKPENILVLGNGSDSPQDWDFKLADLGISHFQRKNSSREDSTASDSYGTHTYGAPEASRPDENTARNKLRVKQNIDIWSLGCIYSEAVRWMAESKPGVMAYQTERNIELRQNYPNAKLDCFHDGFKALETVRRSHQTALNCIKTLQRPDFITEKVVDLIGDMLVETDHRPTAEYLWRKQRIIVDAAKKNLREYGKTTYLLAADSNSSDHIQPRSVTHPVPSPSSKSEPRLPPVLPPERRQAYGNMSFALPRIHEQNTENPFENTMPGYDIPRHHSPEIIEPESRSQETTPVQGMGGFDVSQGRSPSIPAFSLAPQHPLQPSSRNVDDDPFISSMKHDATSLPYRSAGPRGASELPGNSAYSTPGLPGSSSSPGHSGALGHNHQHQARSSFGPTDNSSPDVYRPLSTFEPSSRGSSSYQQQRDTWHPSSTTSPNTAVNDFPDTNGAPYGPARPHSTALDHQGWQRSGPNHRPALTPSVSDCLYLGDVLDSKRVYKSSGGTKIPCLNKQRQDRLKGRDHVFLIDDSHSMVQHWKHVVDLVEGLSYILKDVDKNGLDLHFTISDRSALEEKHTKSLVQLVQAQKQRDLNATTDINYCLTKILDRYKAKLDNDRWWTRKPKPLSLYILTDAIWESECKPEIPIMNVVRKLQDLRKDREQIGLQFISFGNDPIAMERLRYLDDDLTNDLNLEHDIVDTTPWHGNIYKMLLGHLNANMDHQ